LIWNELAVITAEQIIEHFDMKPQPNEGGYYVETYRCKEMIEQANLPAGYNGPRNFGTSILYLLTPNTFSALHRLKSNEMFHFYLGDPVTMLQLQPNGGGQVITLGQDISSNQQIQVHVPANTWQGCLLNQDGEFALMGTTVTPGFEFDDFELADRQMLLREYPQHEKLINRLTRE
jgi:predicted cupin superfamily sugar epimerase